MSTTIPEKLLWPLTRLGEAVEALAQQAGFVTEPIGLDNPAAHLAAQQMTEWLAATAVSLHLEVVDVETTYSNVDKMLAQAAPALVQLPDAGVLLLVKSGRERITAVARDLTHHVLPVALVQQALTQPVAGDLGAQVERLLAAAAIPPERQHNARQRIIAEHLGPVPIGGCWLLRLSPSTNFWQQMRHAQLPKHLIIIMVAQMVQQALGVLGGWLILRGALQGHFDWAWLWAWGLVMLTSLPFAFLLTWHSTLLTVGISTLFKQRLLFGTLQLHPEEIKHQGVGQFLGRVMESEAVEGLALNSGFTAIMGFINVITATLVLAAGAGGWLHAGLFLLWVLFTLLLGVRYYLRSRRWVESHRHITNDLVERMVGHRTRLAQEDFLHWHDEEDQILAQYTSLSSRLDRVGMQLNSVVGRGWMLLGLVGVAYAFIFNPLDTTTLAISFGGIVAGGAALARIQGGIVSLAGMATAWEQFIPLFGAAVRAREQTTTLPVPPTAATQEQALLVVRDAVFRYRENGRAVLNGCHLRIAQGDRLLLEGPSGGGKSTLASLLAGLRQPNSGLLLLQGLDYQTVGQQAWQQHIVFAPQFHENHVLTETFAFNLLMGRSWPPSNEDLAEAHAVCQELGLGELLERMPSGFQQMVGESGWQLSHGERSRLYIARALLQRASFIILDESFAALDPENLQRALDCVLRRAPTLLVIAHP